VHGCYYAYDASDVADVVARTPLEMAWLDRTISMTAPALRFLAQDVVHALPDALFKVGADGLIGEVLHRPGSDR
jgi:hypothetical protein